MAVESIFSHFPASEKAEKVLACTVHKLFENKPPCPIFVLSTPTEHVLCQLQSFFIRHALLRTSPFNSRRLPPPRSNHLCSYYPSIFWSTFASVNA